jgi:hypothetical protein
MPLHHSRSYYRCSKKMYTQVNVPYYNVYTSFWDTLYCVAEHVWNLQESQRTVCVIQSSWRRELKHVICRRNDYVSYVHFGYVVCF